MTRPASARLALGLVSLSGAVALYALAAGAYARPDVVPPPSTLVTTLHALVTGEAPAGDEGHAHPSGHVGHLVAEAVSLPRAVLASTARVLVGVVVGGVLGVVLGLAMGWSQRAGEYLHPVYVLGRSIPPLALITYVMLWLGHGEAHRLVPIVYAVLTTLAIPAYHATRDVADVYVEAARALGAPRRLLLTRVVLPAVSPAVLSGLRLALVIAWMTTVGVEMLMGEDGLGHLIAGGGIWSSRTSIGVDPAVVIVAIAALAAMGCLMDGAVRMATSRLTAWSPARHP